MANIFEYFKGTLTELIQKSKDKSSTLTKAIVARVSKSLVEDLKVQGVLISEEYVHVVDNNAIRHTLNHHGGEAEVARGQVPLTEEILLSIPEIVTHYDSLTTSKNRRGQDVILYSKTYDNGVTVYVEEVRSGRKELAMDTMYIQKK